ncbi:MAG: DUF58 domain-containing protein [Phycisphaerales bacterium]|nr:DUF58 domain-containing protein [Phycisphaerae bacterium]NNF43717.1 DUF58 domain-containing protein [Phycisphaerales bacterium]NNM25302.1 DUF58 domain-containing protein [Phycisphaerales bacterium]
MADGSAVRAENYLAPETLAQLAPFELRAKMIVEGVMSGMHRSPYQGMAVEFAQHRQYVAGDDPKHLDWKVFGRSDKLYIKQYQQETNLDVVLLVDASSSMRYGTLEVKKDWGGTTASDRVGRWTKFDHATALATAMSYLCLHQQDRVGVVVFADDVRTLIKRSSSQGQWRRIVGALRSEPVDAPTNLAKVADQVLGKINNRALFIIISDLFETPEAIRQALARFRHRRHDVVLLNTLDRQEMQFDFTQPAPFEGLENEGRIRVDPRALREAYLESLSAHLSAVARTALGFGFDYHRVDTHESVGPPLAYLLARRSAFLKRSKAG